jgi:FKBP-type peptidyl-prolyl cis-trans isomerase
MNVRTWLVTLAAGVCLLPAGCSDALDEGKARQTQSGLKVLDLQEGTGETPPPYSRVEIHYTCWLKDNLKKIESTHDRKQPFTFLLGAGEALRGVEEGVSTMKVGGKRRLFVPPTLAYGLAGSGRDIPPNAELVFEVELLQVQEGLKIEDLVVGSGPEVKEGAKVTVHYTGRLKSTGVKFDSSLDRDKPANFYIGMGKVIKGWDIGMVGMKVGGKRRLTIPSALGYGASGAGDKIPPDSDLVFEIECLGVDLNPPPPEDGE